MPEQEGVKPINKNRFMTHGSNMTEEQPKVGEFTLADTDNLQVTPNGINLGNTKGSSTEKL